MLRRRSSSILVLLALLATTVFLFNKVRGPTTSHNVQLQKHQKTVVVASTKDADTSWVHRDLPDWTPAIYVADDPTAPLHPAVNKGREANMYLTYIIDHYDSLPEVMVFLHHHRWAYHVDKAFPSNPASVQRLNLTHVRNVGYQGLNCWQPATCSIESGDWFDYADDFLKDAWEALFHTPMPHVVSGPLYAQFAVSKAQVRQRPKSDYEHYLHWLTTTDQHDQVSGRNFEHTWHVIFGKPAVFCQRRVDCLCQAFDFCDLGNPDVQRAIDATRHLEEDGSPAGYKEWKAEMVAKGKEAESGPWNFALWQLNGDKQEKQEG